MKYERPSILVFFDEVLKFLTSTLSHEDGMCNCTGKGSRVCHGA